MSQVVHKKSPRAPSMALDEALERTLRALERQGLGAVPAEVVAQNLGYKSVNSGTALAALASLRYFGLLDRPKVGFLAVSKNVESYKLAPNETARRSILIGFLKNPPLFAQLLDQFRQGLPPESSVRSELIHRSFAPVAAESVLISFIKSIEFVNYYDGTQSDMSVAIPAQKKNDSESDDAISPTIIRSQVSALRSTSEIKMFDDVADKIPVRLRGGRRAWLIIPVPFFAADKARLKAQIDLILTMDEEGA